MDSDDYRKQAHTHQQLPPPLTRPPRLHLKASKAIFDKSYAIGDPVYFEDSLEPYTFLGVTDKRYNDVGQEEYVAEFLAPSPEYPPSSIHLKLHHRIYRDRIPLPPHIMSWDWIKDKLRKYCCL
jgi:hypothetical protein